MSNIDYTALINDDIVEETPAVMSMRAAPASEGWTRSYDYVWHNNIEDPDISEINKKKVIKLHENQVNLTQESYSQYIPFKTTLYQDGFSLLNTAIGVNYLAPGMESPAEVSVVNVQYSESANEILFYWLVGPDVVANKGTVKFEIVARGETTNEEGKRMPYVWRSRPNTLEVLESLGDGGEPVINDYWQTELIAKVSEVVANTITKESLGENYYNKEEIDSLFGTVEKPDLSPYAKITDLQSAVSTLENADAAIADAVNEIETSLGSFATTESLDSAKEELTAAIETAVDALEAADTSINESITANKADADEKIAEINESIATTNAKFGNLGTHEVPGEEEVESTIVENTVVDYVGQAINTKTGELKRGETTYNTVKEYVDSIDISDRLGPIDKYDEEGNLVETRDVAQFVIDSIESVDISSKLEEDYYNKKETEELIESKIGGVELENYYNKEETANLISQTVNNSLQPYSGLPEKVEELDTIVASIDKTPKMTYDVDYVDGVFKFWEKQGDEEPEEPKKQFTITGGAGTGNKLTINYVTTSPIRVLKNSRVEISYKFSGQDSAEDFFPEATATWRVNGKKVATQKISTLNADGSVKINTFDITEHLKNQGTEPQVTVTISVEGIEDTVSKTWKVKITELSLDCTYDDSTTQLPETPINLIYSHEGDAEKTIHFVIDGVEIGTTEIKNSISGKKSYDIPGMPHGAHVLEVYMTAKIGEDEYGLEKIGENPDGTPIYKHTINFFKNLIWFDPDASVPVVGTIYKYIELEQFSSFEIPVIVYDPKASSPELTILIDGIEVKKEKVKNNKYNYPYIGTDDGTHTVQFKCGADSKTVNILVKKLDIDIDPVTTGLVFDFNPVGKRNDDEDRLWSYDATINNVNEYVNMTVEPGFDWINGGYQKDLDELGNEIPGTEHFCVKAGSRAIINYKLFKDDAASNGKAFKVIFKTTNIKNRNTSFLNCLSDNIGIDMKVENAYIYSDTKSLSIPYSEDDIIEFEFNIQPASDDGRMLLTYEDGVTNLALEYGSQDKFQQNSTKNIVIGSDDCDVHIYRMKAYNIGLTSDEVLRNFVLDGRTSAEIVGRYNRNQIYTSGKLDAIELANKCPDLKVVMLEVPCLSKDKTDNETFEDTNIYMYHSGGDTVLDNWTCIGAKHKAQGTSSIGYGYAGFNLDLLMDGAEITLGDGKTKVDTVSLSRDSVPVNYFNIKVNIASSENANNAQFAKLYNDWNPYKRPKKLIDSRVKDTMDFYNCVVFIRETGVIKRTEIVTEDGKEVEKIIETAVDRRQFNDDAWHFYAIGNIGDSKKTDNTRVNDPNDAKEFILEIEDVDVPLYNFPKGEGGWDETNEYYKILHEPWESHSFEKGKLKKFCDKSYSFRYQKKGITEDEQKNNIKQWQEFYDFVVTATDKDFHDKLNEWFVTDSALYYYLFTERYTMVDNRAKNSFWHYGKAYFTSEEAKNYPGLEEKYINDAQAAIREGYRWDLCFAYDMDTSLGIDNVGVLAFSYGQEDTDYYENTETGKSSVFRAADSTFFVRLRDLFKNELKILYGELETQKGAWNSKTLIDKWDTAQSQFPEQLWRLDFERKYLRTYTGKSVDNSISQGRAETYLTTKYQGRKKYQRRMFERNQENYMSSKYASTFVTKKGIYVRSKKITDYDSSAAPNHNITLVPYSNMYVCYRIGTTGESVSERAYQGIDFTIESDYADIIYIYGADYIQKINDLSLTYFEDASFAQATRLQELKVGRQIKKTVTDIRASVTSIFKDGKYLYSMDPLNTTVLFKYPNIKISSINPATKLSVSDFELRQGDFDGKKYHYIHLTKESGDTEINDFITFNIVYDAYVNSQAKFLGIGSNKMLEKLDVCNLTALNSELDLSQCPSLKEFYANGAGLTGVSFANGGRLQIAELPNIKTLAMSNLNEIDPSKFKIDGYDNLITLNIQHCPTINTYEIASKAINLNRVTLLGINWPESYNIPNGELLDRILSLRITPDGEEQPERAILTGQVVLQRLRSSQKENYYRAWGEDLTVNNIPGGYIEQVKAEFKNDGVLVDVQYVDKGIGRAVDPITREIDSIDLPTRVSSISEDYSFSGWEPAVFNVLYSDTVYNAQYTSTPRKYSVKYKGIGVSQEVQMEGEYGTTIAYPENLALPNREVVGNTYYLFTGWDKSGYLNGDENHFKEGIKEIQPVYDSCSYFEGYFTNEKAQLENLRPVELKMLSDLIRRGVVEATVGKNNSLNIIGGNHKYNFELGNDFNYQDIESQMLIYEDQSYKASEQKLSQSPAYLMSSNQPFVMAIDFTFGEENSDGATLVECHDHNQSGFRIYQSGSGDYAELRLLWGPIENTLLLKKEGGEFKREIIVIERKEGSKTLDIYCSQKSKDSSLYTSLTTSQAPLVHNAPITFGGRKSLEGRESNYANATIHWCKIWHGVLGEQVCKELATWPHEQLTMTPVMGQSEPIIYSGCAMTFLSDYVLDVPKTMFVSNNSGGWGESIPYDYLNNRLYNSFSIQNKQLLRNNVVSYLYWDEQHRWPTENENYSNNIKSTNNYLFLPARIEVEPSTSEVYKLESMGGTINTFVYNDSRKCRDRNGELREYWLRTPVINQTNRQAFVDMSGAISALSSAQVYNSKYLRPMLTI